MAACLVVGLFAGRAGWFACPAKRSRRKAASWSARGALAQALSTQLASAQAVDAPVKIGLSYLSKGDEYCRTFTSKARPGGLACRRGNEWELRVLTKDAPAAGPAAPAPGRIALPPAVIGVMAEQIQGNPLDAEAERGRDEEGVVNRRIIEPDPSPLRSHESCSTDDPGALPARCDVLVVGAGPAGSAAPSRWRAPASTSCWSTSTPSRATRSAATA